MRQCASRHGFGGLGWLVTLTTLLEASSIRGPADDQFRRAIDVRGPAAERASQDQPGQETSGDIRRVLGGSLVEAPGKDQESPPADLGGVESESAGSKRQNAAGDTDAVQEADSDSDEAMPSRKKQKVEVGPGFELTWDKSTEYFASYAEQMGFPLGVEPHNLKLVIEREVGRGEYARVYDARLDSPTNEQPLHVAVKFLDYSPMGSTRAADLQEMFMTEFKEMATEMEVSLRPFGHKKSNILITELANVSLKQWAMEAKDLSPGGHPDLAEVRKFMTSISYGLTQLHRHGIALLDVTLDSFLLSCPATVESCKLVFSGFGYACVFNKTGTLVTDEEDLALHCPCTTIHAAEGYMPPELAGAEILEDDEVDMAAGQDVWGAGLVFLILLDPVWAGSGIFKPGELNHLTPAILDRLHKDPEPVIDDLLLRRADLNTSPLGQSLVALLRKMLDIGEADRASAEECYRELLLMQPASE